MCRSNIIQYRHGGKESNNNWTRDTIRGSGKCVQGEECTAMAIFDIIFAIIVFVNADVSLNGQRELTKV